MADPAEGEPFEVAPQDGEPVQLPSGGVFYVLTSTEKAWVEDKIERYLSDNHFVNVSDFLDIDKLIMAECLHFRWTLWASRESNYFGEEINPKEMALLADKFAVEIRQLKKALGVDKTTRDRNTGDSSVAARWDNVCRRAEEFGIKRNEEAIQAIESMHRIAAMITYHKNCDPKERAEFHVELEDVIEVIEEEVATFRQIDEEFRRNVQRYWIRDQ